MKLRLVFLYFVVSPLAIAGGTAKREIASVLQEQASAWNAGDIPGYMQGYWKSDSLSFTSGGKVNRGWNATLGRYSRKYDSREKMGKLVFGDLEITILSEDAAWVLGSWKLIRSTDQPHGLFTLVLRRFADGWKIVHDHTSLSAD